MNRSTKNLLNKLQNDVRKLKRGMKMRQEHEQMNKLHIENSSLRNRVEDLKNQVLELTMKNAELKDKLNNIGEHAETDGYEVGSASDYEIDPQLNLFEDNTQMSIFESPDGGKTVYERKAGDYNNRKKISG